MTSAHRSRDAVVAGGDKQSVNLDDKGWLEDFFGAISSSGGEEGSKQRFRRSFVRAEREREFPLHFTKVIFSIGNKRRREEK